VFHLSPSGTLAVAQIPKAGLCSIGLWLSGFSLVSNDAAMDADRRIAFIRHPIERLRSCYSFFVGLAESGSPHHSMAPLESWQTFVDHILSGASNEHWDSQVALCGGVPNEWIKFESINDFATGIHPAPLPRLNVSIRRQTDDYREDELVSRYLIDLRQWEAANGVRSN
jgi:hypothetical protein